MFLFHSFLSLFFFLSFARYNMTSVSRAYKVGWLIKNWKWFGLKLLWPNRCFSLEIASRGRGKPRRTLLRITWVLARFEPSSLRMKVQRFTATPSKSAKHIVLVQCVNRCRYGTKGSLWAQWQKAISDSDLMEQRWFCFSLGKCHKYGIPRSFALVTRFTKYLCPRHFPQISVNCACCNSIADVFRILSLHKEIQCKFEYWTNSTYNTWREGRDEFETPCDVEERT